MRLSKLSSWLCLSVAAHGLLLAWAQPHKMPVASLLRSALVNPDKEADRARLRDRIQFARLEDSPAFHSPIRDREP